MLPLRITQNEQGQSTEYEADLILAKTRNGDTPEIKIGFIPSQMKFYDLDNNSNYQQTYNSPLPKEKDDLPF